MTIFKKIIASIFIICFAVGFSLTTTFSASESSIDPSQYEKISFYQMGNPQIAGGATFSDYTVNYTHGSDTVGFDGLLNNSVEMNCKFSQNSWPNWLSLTMRAGGFDRTQSPNLTVKGYSLLFMNTGIISLMCNGAELSTFAYDNFAVNVAYKIEFGTYDEDGAVCVFLIVDGIEVVNYLHRGEAAIKTAGFFTICGDGPISASFSPTERRISPYETLSFNNLHGAITANDVDVTNTTIDYRGSGATVGFANAYKNHSFVGSYNFSAFSGWIGFNLRVIGFDRTLSPNLHNKGYTFMCYNYGRIDIYKNGSVIATAWNNAPFDLNKDYIIEVGTVDLPDNKVKLFLSIDGRELFNYVDAEDALDQYGNFIISGDGEIAFSAKAYNPYIQPIKVLGLDDDADVTKIAVKLNSVFSLDSNQILLDSLLSSIMLNGYSLKEINENFSTDNSFKPISLEFTSLSGYDFAIIIQQKIFSKINPNQKLIINNNTLNEIVFLKYKNDVEGFISPSGLILNRDYVFSNLNNGSIYYDVSVSKLCQDHAFMPCMNSSSCDNPLCNLTVDLLTPEKIQINDSAELKYNLSNYNAIVQKVIYEVVEGMDKIAINGDRVHAFALGACKIKITVITPKGAFSATNDIVVETDASSILDFELIATHNSELNIYTFSFKGEKPIYNCKIIILDGYDKLNFISSNQVEIIKSGEVIITGKVNGIMLKPIKLNVILK